MGLSVGIVGLPNVGKSTLFNALLKKQQALVANYPFATIEPNVGVVGVPDVRLATLAVVVKKEEVMDSYPPEVPATVKFVDIAGLVAGASQGEGLGNKFLSHIREVDAIAHVIRDFSDENVIRAGSTDPKSDKEIIETELQVSDINVIEKLIEANKKDTANPDYQLIKSLLTNMETLLTEGKPAGLGINVPERLEIWFKGLPLLTTKPVLFVLNVDEGQLAVSSTLEFIDKKARELDCDPNSLVVISAKVEAELADLTPQEGDEYLRQLGLEKSGLERLIQRAFEILGLQTFLTAGEKEVRAWTIKKGTRAVSAAGVIHTDFEKSFIKAEVVSFAEFVESGGWKKVRESGKSKFEGRDYLMREGDVVEFKIGT